MNFVSNKILYKNEHICKSKSIYDAGYIFHKKFYYGLIIRNNRLQRDVRTITGDETAILYEDGFINGATGLAGQMRCCHSLNFTHPTKEFETPDSAIKLACQQFMLARTQGTFRPPQFLWCPKHKNTNQAV